MEGGDPGRCLYIHGTSIWPKKLFTQLELKEKGQVPDLKHLFLREKHFEIR